MRTKPKALAALFAAALALASAAGAAPTDWTEYADTQTIEILTVDDDGGLRLTTCWIVVVDRDAYIRTSGTTTWGDNLERNGTLKLRGENGDKPLRAEKVLSAVEVEGVLAAFREKYGTTDAVLELIRFGGPRVFRLVE
jgi:hypothetical protein